MINVKVAPLGSLKEDFLSHSHLSFHNKGGIRHIGFELLSVDPVFIIDLLFVQGSFPEELGQEEVLLLHIVL